MKFNKKGVELSLQTIIVFVIAVLVLIVVISYFTQNHSSGVDALNQTSSSLIEQAKEYS